jgi:hypothetical protein
MGRAGWGFLYLFYHDFAKIYDPPQIFQNYTSAVVAHGIRDKTSWPTAVGAARSGPLAWARHSVVRHGVKSLAAYITPKFSRKCHNNSKKEKRGGRGEGGEEEVVKVRSSAGFSSRQR